jgi:molybdate transport system substrate-binding protein
MRRRAGLLVATVFLSGVCASAVSAPARPAVSIAAAANLVYVLEALETDFKRLNPGVVLTSTIGASGSLYAQVRNGAPFDVFLSADTEYPEQIAAAGLGPASTLHVFATGRIVVWTMRAGIDLSDLRQAIQSPAVRRVALAQPRTAPYGRAAQAALEHSGVWREAQPKLVFGENIAQTAQFVETSNADLGIVALSFVLSPRLANKGRWKEIAPESYRAVSLDHAAILTHRGAANPAAAQYLEFLRGPGAKKILRDFGYATPGSEAPLVRP